MLPIFTQFLAGLSSSDMSEQNDHARGKRRTKESIHVLIDSTTDLQCTACPVSDHSNSSSNYHNSSSNYHSSSSSSSGPAKSNQCEEKKYSSADITGTRLPPAHHDPRNQRAQKMASLGENRLEGQRREADNKNGIERNYKSECGKDEVEEDQTSFTTNAVGDEKGVTRSGNEKKSNRPTEACDDDGNGNGNGHDHGNGNCNVNNTCAGADDKMQPPLEKPEEKQEDDHDADSEGSGCESQYVDERKCGPETENQHPNFVGVINENAAQSEVRIFREVPVLETSDDSCSEGSTGVNNGSTTGSIFQKMARRFSGGLGPFAYFWSLASEPLVPHQTTRQNRMPFASPLSSSSSSTSSSSSSCSASSSCSPSPSSLPSSTPWSTPCSSSVPLTLSPRSRLLSIQSQAIQECHMAACNLFARLTSEVSGGMLYFMGCAHKACLVL